MSEPPADKPPRRRRYSGTHPRQFHEKYKEHQPERYSADIAKLIDQGKTPAGTHRPIMVGEILEVLHPQPGDMAVDCTLGYGGHARELLQAVQPGGRLIAVDADPLELPRAEARLRQLGFPDDSLIVRRMNHAGIGALLATEAPGGADVVLADLGLSSMQIDDPERGFSFKLDGPLDMRMNPRRGMSAAEFLAQRDVDRLAEILSENADEPQAERLAREILEVQTRTPLTTTVELAEAVRQIGSRWGRGAEATELSIRRVFQAIRIHVNDEFGSLQSFLRQLPTCLKPGGRVAILTFHSGEDRRVKAAFKAGMAAGDYARISEEVVRASMEEQRSNPRSTSAKLRFAVRTS